MNINEAVETLKTQLGNMAGLLDVRADEETEIIFVHTTDPRVWVDIPATFPKGKFEVQMVVEQWGHWKSTVYENTDDYRLRNLLNAQRKANGNISRGNG